MSITTVFNYTKYVPTNAFNMYKVLQVTFIHYLCYVFRRLFAIFREPLIQGN